MVTFFVSSLWHGMYAGYYVSLFSVPFYLVVEDIFQKRVVQDQNSKIVSIYEGCSIKTDTKISVTRGNIGCIQTPPYQL